MYVTGTYSTRESSSSITSEQRFREHLIKAGGIRTPQAGGVGVAGEADDRDFRPRIGDLLGLDSGDVRDHELGLGDRVGRDQVMARQQAVELPAEEKIDPDEQDRRHRQ